MHKRTIPVFVITLVATLPTLAEPPAYLSSAERILFLGDSITYAGHYVNDVETAWRLRQGGAAPEMINLGLPSETCSGLSEPDHPFPRPDVHERLQRALDKTRPDVVVACYGMNDGIYYPFDQQRFAAYQDGINRLIEKVQDYGAKLILMTPPPFDPLPLRKQEKLRPVGADKFAWFAIYEGYDDVLARYAAWLMEQRDRVDMVIDLHTPVSQYVGRRRETEPDFTFSSDGVHLNAAGHRVLSATILDAWGMGAPHAAPAQLAELVRQRERLLHAAWVSHVGHLRPDVAAGLPLDEAKAQAAELQQRIADFLAELNELRAARKQAAQRRRRMIFNNDGNTVVYNLKDKEVSAEALLADRTTGLVGTHCDSIFYCTWSTGLGQFTHISDVAEPFYATTRIFANNRTREFHDQGLDPLKIMVEYCQQKEIEIFWSIRMNDIHDSWERWSELLSQFKKDNPQLLFGSAEQGPPFGKWSGADYAQPEVRERAFRIIEDVCLRYDVDGIELDFNRHIPHFKRNALGEDCTQYERDLMTGLLRRLREMTEQVGLERGRPLLIAARFPASVSFCEALGLDVVRWAERDLVDLMIPSEYEFSRWEDWVALGEEHDVQVYPGLSWTGSKKRKGPPAMQSTIQLGSLRSRAMNIWNAGADGVYLFNYFFVDGPAWRELGDPELLAGLDKDYFPHGYWRVLLGQDTKHQERFIEVPLPPFPERPVFLKPGESHTVILAVGDDVAAAAQGRGAAPVVTLSVTASDVHAPDGLIVTLNGQPLEEGLFADAWTSYSIAPAWVIQGENQVGITNPFGSGEKIGVRDVHLRVDY